MDNLHVAITGDNQGFVNALNGARDKVRSTARDIEQSGMSIEQMFGRIKLAAAGALAGFSIKEFAGKVVQVRGEFQQLEVAFTTMLGSAKKANSLMQQLTKTAAITPFDLQGVTQGAKQLLAYGIAADEVNDTLIRLGDIAAGLSIPLGDLVYLYGTTMTQGRMFTQDLRQFQGRGIPIAEELAKQFGVAKDKVQELVSTGKVGAKEFNQAILSMSTGGGKFAGLMEAQSKTITGQISNIEDAIDTMFNEIGQKSEGIINGTLSVISSLVENYEKVGKVILGLVSIYGAYKVAVMTYLAVQKVHTAWLALEETAHLQNVLATEADTAAKGKATIATVLFDKANKALNATMLANPYVLVGMAIVGLTAIIYKAVSATDAFDEAQERLTDETKTIEGEVLKELNRLDELNRRLQECEKGSNDYKNAKQAIIDQFGQYFSGLDAEIEKTGNLSGVYDRLTESIRRSIGARNLQQFYEKEMGNYDTTVSDKLDKAYKALKKKYGENEGSQLYHKLYSSAVLGNRNALSASDIVKLQQTTGDSSVWGLRWGKNAKDGLVDFQVTVDELREEIFDAKAASDKVLKQYKDMYEITDEQWNQAIGGNQTTPTNTNPTPTSPTGGKGGGGKGSSWNQAHAIADAKQLMDGWSKEIGELLSDINQDIADAEVASLDESTEKTLAKLDEDEKKEQQAIEKQRRNLIEKRKELDLKLWEKAAEGNDQYNFKEKSDEDYVKMIEAESPELLKALDKRSAQIAESFKKQREEVAKLDAEAMRDYLKEYGTYQERKLAIQQEYEERMKGVSEGYRLTLQKQYEAELEELDERFGHATQFMVDLFENASEKSVSEIQRIIDKYEALVKFLKGDGSISRDGLVKSFGFTDAEIDKVIQKFDRGEITIKEFTDALKSLKGDLEQRSPWKQFEVSLTKAIEKLKTAKGNSDKLGQGISEIGSAVSAFAPQLQQFSSDIANIFDFDDTKIQKAIGAVDGLGTTAAGVGQAMSGDIVGGMMTAINGVSKMVDAFDGMFGADYSSYNRMVDEYDKLISIWDELIDSKKEYISMSYGMEADRAGKEAIELVNKQTEAYRKLGKERLNSGASAGSSSIGRRITKGMGNDDWNNIANALGMTIDAVKNKLGSTRLTGIFDLSAEELKAIKENAYDFWASLDDDVQKYLQGIIDGEKQIADLEKQTTEQVLSTSFDGIFDNFMSALDELASGSEEVFDNVAENWEKMMNQMVLRNLVGKKYEEELRAWYKQWEAAYTGDGQIDKAEINALRDDYNSLIHKAADEVEALRANGLITSPSESPYKQEASTGAWQSMGQETAEELNGRFTALQESGERIAAGITTMVATVDSLVGISQERNTTVVEIRNLMIYNNAYLEDILTVSKKMYNDFGQKLDKININTK